MMRVLKPGWLLLWIVECVLCLRDIQLSVPDAVSIGGTATLGCKWNLDPGEALYTVKWYHGAQEFFRYIPKELPNTRVFPRPAITVDVGRSGAQQVVLRNARRSYSGRYRCEVSADAPYFHTVYKSSFMHVVELPDAPPVIAAAKIWYSTDDLLKANCTAPPADPPANLTWLLNSEEVKGLPIDFNHPVIKTTTAKSQVYHEDANTIIFSPWKIRDENYTTTNNRINRNVQTLDVNNNIKNNKRNTTKSKSFVAKYSSLNSTTDEKASDYTELNSTALPVEETRVKYPSGSTLILRVKSDHFVRGRMNLTCIAKVFSEYTAKAELVIEEVKPQLAPVMGSLDTSAGIHRGFSSCALVFLVFVIMLTI